MSSNPIYYLSDIDKNTLEYLNLILENKLEDVKPSYWTGNRSVSIRVNQYKTETLRKIVDIAKTYFEKAGLTINENNGYIDYYSYAINNTKYDKNDYGNIYSANEALCGCHECVFITRKDDIIKGGNLHIYKENPYTFLRLFGLEEDPKRDTSVLKTGSVFVCSGDTLHEFLNCGGMGMYNMIKVTLYDHQRDGYRSDNDDD
jgi:hypothetical protein